MRGTVVTAAAALAVAVAALVGACGDGPEPPPAPAAAPAAPLATVPTLPVSPSASAPAPPDPGPVRPASHLTSLSAPTIGMRTGPLMELGLDADGALEVPPDAGTAGRFTLGPSPGELGPAVIAGHVDYRGVSGVFARLDELAPGDEVSVQRADGATAVFDVYRVDRYPKSSFPTEQVYGDTAGPELRLITCGGDFDRGTGHYLDNVVAYARLVEVR